MATYSDKLRDPRWQKKRLEIMQRDGFACAECTNDTETLHVHHLRYLKGVDPWDHPNELLVTLCHQCHECLHSGGYSSSENLLYVMHRHGAKASFLYVLTAWIEDTLSAYEIPQDYQFDEVSWERAAAAFANALTEDARTKKS